MNFLAHLYLARPTDESLIGNLLGDFVKGTTDSLKDDFPPGIIEGIRQHRAIDAYTDSHPTFSEARSLLSPERSRFAGIIVDIFYDHFLSKHWPNKSQSREDFIQHCYQTLSHKKEWLTPVLVMVLPRMKRENWLEAYSTIDGLRITFQRVAQRSPKVATIIGAEEDLLKNYDDYEKLYFSFFEELESFTQNWLENAKTEG